MSNYRNPKLRELAHHAPHCMRCGVSNHGQVVGAHSDTQEDGKGMGLKAHDLLAYVCGECNDYFSGPGPREERRLEFYRAYYRSMLWAFKDEFVKVMLP